MYKCVSVRKAKGQGDYDYTSKVDCANPRVNKKRKKIQTEPRFRRKERTISFAVDFVLDFVLGLKLKQSGCGGMSGDRKSDGGGENQTKRIPKMNSPAEIPERFGHLDVGIDVRRVGRFFEMSFFQHSIHRLFDLRRK